MKTLLSAILVLALVPSVRGQTPSKRIDAEIARQLQAKKIPASPGADDAEFLRRVYLDLTGQIPPYEKAVEFLDSKDPQRRAKLIDELLASPDFGRHFAGQWSQLILGSEINAGSREQFRTWLADQLNKGVTWDRIVREVLTGEGEPKQNPATVFTLAQTDNNKIQPNLLAATTTRYFLGVQLQCAECHNHPFTGWKQQEFWGIAAFFARVKNVPANKNNLAAGITETTAVVDKKENKKTPEPGGAKITIPGTAGKAAGQIIKAKFLEAEEPAIDAEKSFRPSLAKWVTARDNKFFARAAANRVWAQLFGRGLVNPVDDMHADNEATHPELLRFLAEEFKASGCDMKHLMRCVCNSETYQRSSRTVAGNKDDRDAFSHMASKVMSPETLYSALTRALGVKDLDVSTGKTATTGIGGAAKAGATNKRDRFLAFFKTQDADTVATDFTHGIPQALNLMNDPQFNRGGPVVDQIVKEKLSGEQAVERLFLTVLSRRPTQVESQRLVRFVAAQQEHARGYAGVLWILVNTPEFILVH